MQTKSNAPLLLVGGMDPSGAGLSTDIQVAQSFQCSVRTIVSAVTVQTHSKLLRRGLVSADHFRAQLACIDFTQLRFVKVGMLGSKALLEVLCEMLPASVSIILDPVIKSSSKGALLDDDGVDAMQAFLFPRVSLITPNLDELSRLSGMEVHNKQTLTKACQVLLNRGIQAVFVKGGHFQSDSADSRDYYCDSEHQFWLSGRRWPDRNNVRGTGCAVATAIACQLNKGHSLSDALVIAKASISQSIEHSVPEGQAYQGRHRGLPQSYRNLPGLYPAPDFTPYSFASCDTDQLGIYPVVDSVEWIEKLVTLGVSTIQLRIKHGDTDTIQAAIKAAVAYCAPRKVRLFINDYWALAIQEGAYGVHLGQEDVEQADLGAISRSGLRLGLSSHCWTEVARAIAIGPSYLALGPIYETTSKDMPWQPQGAAMVQHWVDLFEASIPLVAIGGITLERAKCLKATGVGSVAMISEITEAQDYVAATQALLDLWQA